MLLRDNRKQKIPIGKQPELKESNVRIKLFNKIRFLWTRNKALIGAGTLAVGLIVTGSWGIILQVVGTSLIGAEGLHEIGRQSKYGKKGEFNKDDLAAVLKDLWIILTRLYKIIISKPKL